MEHSDNTIQAIKYSVSQVSGAVLKTQLIKFLYLADVEYSKLTGRPITTLRYKLWHYGPYDKRFEEQLKWMVQHNLISAEPWARVLDGAPYEMYHDTDKTLQFTFTPAQRATLDAIIHTYKNMELKQLLDEIVYKTKPMQEAQKKRLPLGTPLDMDCVNNIYHKDITRLNAQFLDLNLTPDFLPA